MTWKWWRHHFRLSNFRSLDIRISKFPAVRNPDCSDFRMSGCPKFIILGCLSVHNSGCLLIRISVCLSVRMSGCPRFQIPRLPDTANRTIRTDFQILGLLYLISRFWHFQTVLMCTNLVSECHFFQISFFSSVCLCVYPDVLLSLTSSLSSVPLIHQPIPLRDTSNTLIDPFRYPISEWYQVSEIGRILGHANLKKHTSYVLWQALHL